jgi:hypothetical protein
MPDTGDAIAWEVEALIQAGQAILVYRFLSLQLIGSEPRAISDQVNRKSL